jgi:hypothetical protein
VDCIDLGQDGDKWAGVVIQVRANDISCLAEYIPVSSSTNLHCVYRLDGKKKGKVLHCTGIEVKVKVKVKCTIVQALRLCTGREVEV